MRIVGTLYDGTGATVPDGMVETWQADPDGRFDHSDDPRGASAEWAERGFTGFARASTVDGGSFEIVTVKPGPLPFGDGRRQAPHLDVSVFARGMLRPHGDPALLPRRAGGQRGRPGAVRRRPGAPAHAGGRGRAGRLTLRFDIHLQGEHETVFFAL